MKTNMQERLVDATIEAIEQDRGSTALSLRSIAQAAGCSHVNVYHYAAGLTGLRWLAYGRAMLALSSFREATKPLEGENFGQTQCRAMLGFAMEHEGLHRLLWLDPIEGEPTGPALEAIVRAQASYRAHGLEAMERELGRPPRPGEEEAMQSLFIYMHGEAALLVNGRSGADRRAVAEAACARAGRLWDALLGGARMQ